MTALYRTLTFEQMHHAPVVVPEDLHFHVPGPLDKTLDVERAVAERRESLSTRLLHGIGNLGTLADQPHALAAAAGGRFHERRKAHSLDGRPQRFVGLFAGSLARDDGHAGLLHQPPGVDLRA